MRRTTVGFVLRCVGYLVMSLAVGLAYQVRLSRVDDTWARIAMDAPGYFLVLFVVGLVGCCVVLIGNTE